MNPYSTAKSVFWALARYNLLELFHLTVFSHDKLSDLFLKFDIILPNAEIRHGPDNSKHPVGFQEFGYPADSRLRRENLSQWPSISRVTCKEIKLLLTI